jgi:hypothetical protein
VEYFMKRRPHQGLKQQLPDSTEEPQATGCIRSPYGQNIRPDDSAPDHV